MRATYINSFSLFKLADMYANTLKTFIFTKAKTQNCAQPV